MARNVLTGLNRRIALVGLVLTLGAAAIALVLDFNGGTHSQRIAVELNPVAVVLDDETKRAFVISQGSTNSLGEPTGVGTASVIDIETGKIVHTASVGTGPVAAAVDKRTGRVYILNRGASDASGRAVGPGSVSVLEATTGQVLNTVGVGMAPLAIAVAAQAERVLVVNRGVVPGRGSVSILDSKSVMALGEIMLDSYPADLAVSSREDIAFVANFLSNSISLLDLQAMRAIKTVPLTPELGTEPGTLARLVLDEQTGHLFALSFPPRMKGGLSGGRVWMIDSRRAEIISTIMITNPTAMALNAQLRQVLVTGTQGQQGWLTALDASSGRLLWSTRVGENPNNIAVDAEAGRIFVLNRRSGTVSVLEANSGKSVCTRVVGEQPVAIAISSQTHKIFIVTVQDRSLSIWRSVC